MGAGVQQAHRLMLAVDLDKKGAELAQNAHPGGLIVDEGARTPVGGEDPAQDQILVAIVRQSLFVEAGPDGVIRRRGEDGRGRGLGRAYALALTRGIKAIGTTTLANAAQQKQWANPGAGHDIAAAQP